MPDVVRLGVVIGLRSLTAFAAEWLAHRTAATAMSQLRMAAWRHMMSLGPAWLSNQRTGELAQLLVRGIGGLEPYYARYLPQLVLAVVVPLIVGTAILTQDVLAAVIVALTVPLIPVFMILVGWASQARVDRQWRWLSVLGNHFLDVVEGLPTLKAFNRAQHQVGQIRKVGEEHRQATMGVLRITFLSALVLELLSTLSVALIAVSIGVRLVAGDMTLMAGLTVLILAPEVYLPLRMVGQHFHAAAEGADAADRVFAIMEQQPPTTGTQPPGHRRRRHRARRRDARLRRRPRAHRAVRHDPGRPDHGDQRPVRGGQDHRAQRPAGVPGTASRAGFSSGRRIWRRWTCGSGGRRSPGCRRARNYCPPHCART